MCTARPLIEYVFEGRVASCFAYGQTGSGKTWTMSGEAGAREPRTGRPVVGVYQMVARDIFRCRDQRMPQATVHVSFFEIYGGEVYDLLHKRQRLRVLENGRREVCVTGLQEYECTDEEVRSTRQASMFVLMDFVCS